MSELSFMWHIKDEPNLAEMTESEAEEIRVNAREKYKANCPEDVEGPITTEDGKIVYYIPKEKRYFDPGDVIWKIKNGLIIVDMFDTHPSDDKRFDSLLEQMMLRIFDAIRGSNKPVVLACHNTFKVDGKWKDKAPHHMLEEAIIHNHIDNVGILSWDKDEVVKFFKSHGVTDLYYAGVSFPGMVQHSPIGMNNMKREFRCHITSDCVLNMIGTGYTDYEILQETYEEIRESYMEYKHIGNIALNELR